MVFYFAKVIKISGKTRYLQSEIMLTSESSLFFSASREMTVLDER